MAPPLSLPVPGVSSLTWTAGESRGLFLLLSDGMVVRVFTPARESEGWHQTEVDALMGNDAVHHLRHHGINAVKYRAVGQKDEIPVALIQESRKLNTNLLVMRS